MNCIYNTGCIAFQFKLITTVDELKSYIDSTQLTPEFGGVFHYDHDEWIRFRIVSGTLNCYLLIPMHLNGAEIRNTTKFHFTEYLETNISTQSKCSPVVT